MRSAIPAFNSLMSPAKRCAFSRCRCHGISAFGQPRPSNTRSKCSSALQSKLSTRMGKSRLDSFEQSNLVNDSKSPVGTRTCTCTEIQEICVGGAF